jgi:hypothetical protein
VQLAADDEPIGLGERKGPEHDRIGDSEQDHVRADAEGQQANREQRQLRPRHQRTQRRAKRRHLRQHTPPKRRSAWRSPR